MHPQSIFWQKPVKDQYFSAEFHNFFKNELDGFAEFRDTSCLLGYATEL